MNDRIEIEGPPEWFVEAFFNTLRQVWPNLKIEAIEAQTIGFKRYTIYPVTAKQAYLIGTRHAKYIIDATEKK